MSWTNDEAKTASFGDARLDARMDKVLGGLAEKPGASIPQAMGDWAETHATYRFFDNDKVTFEKVLEPHREATLERIRKQPVVLLPQDTSDCIRVANKGPKGMGTLKNTEKEEIFIHPAIAITPARVPLGTVFLELWKRPEESVRAERQGKPIEEKESFHWIEGYQAACDVQAQAPDTLVVGLADREGDIYEFFAEMLDYAPSQRAAWIVRAAQDRLVEDETARKILEKLKRAPSLGETRFAVPARNGKPGRTVAQAVHAATVVLKPPERRSVKGFRLPPVKINAVLAEEINPPEGEAPVNWLLLTSLPADTFERAATVLQWYSARWEIEIFFRVLKQGCKIEKLQLETEKRFAACLAVYMIIAWRILYATMLGREYPNLDCEAVFGDDEWRTLYIVAKGEAPPDEPPPLIEIVLMLAGLGGFLGRKHDGFPGPQPIWIGLQRLRDFMLAIERYKASRAGPETSRREKYV